MAMGIGMAALTMFGMLGLLIATVRADEEQPSETTDRRQDKHQAKEVKKAA